MSIIQLLPAIKEMRIPLIISVMLIFYIPLIGQNKKYDARIIKERKIKEIIYFTHIYRSEKYPESKGKSQIDQYDEKGNLLWSASFDTSGQIGLEFFYRYDNHGNKVFEKGINHQIGKSDSIIYFNTYKDSLLIKQDRDDTLFTVEWNYDTKGRLIGKNFHNKINSQKNNVKPVEKPETYKYDNKGNLIETYRIDGDFKIKETFKYDHSNRKIERKWIYVEVESDTVGRIFIWERYHYDTKGNIIKEENLGGYGGSPTTTFTYDNNGNLIRQEDEMTLLEYKYDLNGNMISELSKVNGHKIGKIEYQYQYWK